MAPDCQMTFLYWSSLKSHLGYSVLTDLMLKISLCVLERRSSLLSGGGEKSLLSHSLIALRWIATKHVMYYLYFARQITLLKGSRRLLECKTVQGSDSMTFFPMSVQRVDVSFLDRYSYILEDFFFNWSVPCKILARLWKTPLEPWLSQMAFMKPNYREEWGYLARTTLWIKEAKVIEVAF